MSEKTLPIEYKSILIPYELFFAKNSPNWHDGGVAFIMQTKDENKQTYGRMWKVTEEQFLEIWIQEGKENWYKEKVNLGRDDKDIPIFTITNSNELSFTRPSDNYLKTIILGLQETFHLDNE